jgi:hypothetical protein
LVSLSIHSMTTYVPSSVSSSFADLLLISN